MYNEMTTINFIYENSGISLRAYGAIVRAFRRNFFSLQYAGFIPKDIKFDADKITYGVARSLNYDGIPCCGVRTKKELMEFFQLPECRRREER